MSQLKNEMFVSAKPCFPSIIGNRIVFVSVKLDQDHCEFFVERPTGRYRATRVNLSLYSSFWSHSRETESLQFPSVLRNSQEIPDIPCYAPNLDHPPLLQSFISSTPDTSRGRLRRFTSSSAFFCRLVTPALRHFRGNDSNLLEQIGKLLRHEKYVLSLANEL